MKKRKLINHFLVITLLSLISCSLFADDTNPQVKKVLEEALKLYSQNQYVRALDLFKQAQELDPSNSTAEEYIKNTKQRILEWEMKGDDKPTATTKEASPTWDNLTGNRRAVDDTATNAKDIIAARKSLVDKMRNRSSNTDNIVQIKDNGKGLDVTLFHDQLFLPGLQTLRDEALPILTNVADLIRNGPDRDITIRSLAHSDSTDPYMLYPEFPNPTPDPSLPQMKQSDAASLFQDIESIRALVLFSYIAQKSINKSTALATE